jgi:hypothetical protein
VIWYEEGDDIGQLADYSARVILRVEDIGPPNPPVDEYAKPVRYGTPQPTPQPEWTRTMQVVEVTRFDLDIPYTSLVRTLVKDFRRPALTVGPNRPRMAVDITGVGRGVYDMLREAGVGPVGITITGGAHVRSENGIWYVPKSDLVMQTLLLMEQGRLTIGRKVPSHELLLQELRAFKVKTTPSGREQYAAGEEWRDGQHDDLVLALCIAAWHANRRAFPKPTNYAKVQR